MKVNKHEIKTEILMNFTEKTAEYVSDVFKIGNFRRYYTNCYGGVC